MQTFNGLLPRILLVTACLSLAACSGGFRGFGGGGDGPSTPAQRSVAVTADRVVIAGPDGYCVDPGSTRDRGETGFVLLGNCAVITNSRSEGQPDIPAILTAAISAPSQNGSLTANLSELDAFFRSEEGRTLLSRSGEASTVTILETGIEGDVFLMHASDLSDNSIEGVQQDYWRAYLDIGSRIATLTVLALDDREISDQQSRAILQRFSTTVQAANLATDPAAPVSVPVAAPAVPAGPQSLPLETGPLGNVGLFRRWFR